MSTPRPSTGAEPRTHDYGIDAWGQGYFKAGADGHLKITPYGANGPVIDMMDVVNEIKAKGLGFPCIVRFQDILRARVVRINELFRESIKAWDYKGGYYGVFPLKVNPMREVVEEVLDAGAPFDYGLEAGTKPELVIALAYNTNPDALTICNGFKDASFMHLALLGRKLGRKAIVVIERFADLREVLDASKELGVEPMLGIRAKLTTKGAGKWESSAGEFAKFGLSAPELLKACELLKAEGLGHTLKLFHFHLGSQLTDIRVVKNATLEGARMYTKLRKMGFDIEYFDIGGGLAVDYDGTRTTSDSSMNYSLEEYVADVVYNLGRVCDDEGVPHPNIVSESGRAVTAHHSCVLMDVLDSIKVGGGVGQNGTDVDDGSSPFVEEMRAIFEAVTKRNLLESLNDAQAKRDETLDAFRLGIVELEDRAAVEVLYWRTLQRIADLSGQVKRPPRDATGLRERMADQYLGNFSVFQSAIDHWAFKQMFPVVPLQRLDEEPTREATVVDITCDSDGKIERFTDLDGPRSTLPVHELRDGEPYYLGMFLTGAYQDIMGDLHNLFGRTDEIHVFVDDEDPEDFYIETAIPGDVLSEVLGRVQYEPKDLVVRVKSIVDQQVRSQQLKPKDGVSMLEFLDAQLRGYTYLTPKPEGPLARSGGRR